MVFVEHPWVPMDKQTRPNATRAWRWRAQNFYGSGSVWSGPIGRHVYSLLMEAQALEDQMARTWLGAYLQALR